MKTEVELLDGRQARLTVLPDQETVRQAMQKAARRISRHVDIPGFRRGRAPYHIVAARLGEDYIFEEAVDDIHRMTFGDALNQSDLEPWDTPALVDYSYKPPKLVYLIPLEPKVTLPEDYRSYVPEFRPPEVTDEEVDRALDELRERNALVEEVDRPAKEGDLLNLKMVAWEVDEEGNRLDEEPAIREGEYELLLIEDKVPVGREFIDAVVGISAGESRDFTIPVIVDDETAEESESEEDEEETEEKPKRFLQFHIECERVNSYTLPELNDAFASTVGDFETLLELRANVRQQIAQAKEQEARDKFLGEVVDKLLEVAEIEYPQKMLDDFVAERIDDMERDFERRGLRLDDLVGLTGGWDDFEKRIRVDGDRIIRRALVTRELAILEGVTVSDDEVTERMVDMSKPFGANAPRYFEMIDNPETRKRIANSMATDRLVDRLIAISRGEAPEQEAEREEREAADEESVSTTGSDQASGEEPA